MARLIKPTGEIVHAAPANGKQFTIQELHELAGGYIELVPGILFGGNIDMLVNKDGHRLDLPHNPAASLVAQQAILGNAILLHRLEWDTPEGEEI